MARTATVAVIGTLALPACGGGEPSGDTDPEQAPTPAARARPPETDGVLEDAQQRMRKDDFDGALAALDRIDDCPRARDRERAFRRTAAATMLRRARRRLPA